MSIITLITTIILHGIIIATMVGFIAIRVLISSLITLVTQVITPALHFLALVGIWRRYLITQDIKALGVLLTGIPILLGFARGKDTSEVCGCNPRTVESCKPECEWYIIGRDAADTILNITWKLEMIAKLLADTEVIIAAVAVIATE